MTISITATGARLTDRAAAFPTTPAWTASTPRVLQGFDVLCAWCRLLLAKAR